MKPLKTASLLALLVLAAPASGIDPAYDYATIRAGLFVPQANSVRDYGSGMDGELAVGRAFLPFLAGELAVGFARSGGDAKGSYQDRATLEIFETRDRYTLVPFTASVRLILPAGSVEPYLAGGGGLYLVRLRREPIGSPPAVSESEEAAGLHVGGGATIGAGPRFFGGFDARYVFLSAKYFNQGHVALGGLRATAAFGLRF
jgi:hypothetical protein